MFLVNFSLKNSFVHSPASFLKFGGVCKRYFAAMRLVQFSQDGGQIRVGAELGDGGDVADLSKVDSTIPDNMKSFLEGGDEMMNKAKKAIESKTHIIQRSTVQLHAPVHNPQKVVCAGMNYTDHCLEQNAPIPVEPVIFGKFTNTVTGPYSPVIKPDITEELDYEVELAFVIGKTAHKIPQSEAMNYVAGYTVMNDVTARDWQLKKPELTCGQWLLGKTFDTFSPIGPALVTKDAISDPHQLGIRCRVNGKSMQDSTTKNLIFKTEKLVNYISQFMTLVPGDIISTGTPPGVGVFRKPEPFYLKKGDIVECEIDEIGCIKNEIQ